MRVKRGLIIKIIVILAAGALICAALSRRYPLKYAGYINKYAREFGIDPALVCALINRESGFRPGAASKKGAQGLMQLMPGTAAEAAADIKMADYDASMLRDPETNIKLGCAYLSKLLGLFGGDETLSLAAYNAGYGAVGKWDLPRENTVSAIPYRETRNYVNGVLRDRKVYDIIILLSKFVEGI